MTLQIELSDAVLQAAWDACTDYPANISTPRAHMALQATIIAALEAMVKEGTACLAYGQITSDNEGDYWTACDEWRTGDFPALIVRLGGKP